MKLFLFLAASALAQDFDACKATCELDHMGELAKCNLDESANRPCIDAANDMFRRCLQDCEQKCLHDCEQTFANEVDSCGDDTQCISDAERRYKDCMSRCDKRLNFKGDKPTCKEACAKYFAGAAKDCF